VQLRSPGVEVRYITGKQFTHSGAGMKACFDQVRERWIDRFSRLNPA
jgi:hypothetical protein